LKKITFLFVTLIYFTGFAQVEPNLNIDKYTAGNKGKIYIYWGGNRDFFSKSDIRFQGDGYDFTLHDVKAEDKPKGWHIDYINPARMTIPQTNLRIGYFISDKYNISLGVDHMKYVMYQDKKVKYSGYYPDRGSYGEDIEDGFVLLTEDFLTFEHTDGLNSLGLELQNQISLLKSKTNAFSVSLYGGGGVGAIMPKSNVRLLNYARSDRYNLAGFSANVTGGIQFILFKHLQLRLEEKLGYINLPNIALHEKGTEGKGKQQFLFAETVGLIGAVYQF